MLSNADWDELTNDAVAINNGELYEDAIPLVTPVIHETVIAASVDEPADDFLPTPVKVAPITTAKKLSPEQWDDIRRALSAGNRLTLLKHVDQDYKRPMMSGYLDPAVNTWTTLQFEDHARWAASNGIDVTGFGIINGPMSRHRHVLDFDQGEHLESMAAKVKEDTGFDILSLPRVRSGRASSGYHIVLRSTQSLPNTNLAKDSGGQLIVELKGEGGQCVAAGSLHQSGNRYTVEQGDPFDPPVIPFETLQAIVRSLESQTKFVEPPRPAPARRQAAAYVPRDGETSAKDIIERYNAENDIYETLERYGYTHTSGTQYKHPGNGQTDRSVNVLNDKVAHSFSGNDPAGNGPHDAFDLFAAYEHGSDKSKAVKALSDEWGLGRKPLRPAEEGWDDHAGIAPVLPCQVMPGPVLEVSTEPIVLENMDEVKAVPIDWIWPGRLARGKLTLVCGDPGKGKSFLSLDIAARLSTGKAFPDGFVPKIGTTCLITDEDDSADTIKPRLIAMGADTKKVARIKTVMLNDKEGRKETAFSLQLVNMLTSVVRQRPDLQLIVIDPLMSYFGKAKSADAAEVNALLGQLNEWAGKHRIAVVGLVHLNKDQKSGNALYRSMGSISIVGKARLAFLVAADKTDPSRLIVAQTKANAAMQCRSISYQIVPTTIEADDQQISTARVEWAGEVDISADELLSDKDDKASSAEEAEAFIREMLTEDRKSKVMDELARTRGISFITLKRAKDKLGVRSKRTSFDGEWYWCALQGDSAEKSDSSHSWSDAT